MGKERVRCRRACGAAAKGAGAAKSWLAAAGAATITESFEKAIIAHKKLRSSDSEPPTSFCRLHVKLNAVLDCEDALGD